MTDDELRAAIGDAVCDVEPTDRLGEIRRATHLPARRRWYVVGGAAVLAAAVVVTAVAVLAQGDAPRAADPIGPAATTRTSPTAISGPAVPVYYVGPGPDGPNAPASTLYRYFEHGGTPLDLLMRTPSDADYRTLWPVGSLVVASDPEAGLVYVTLRDASLRERPDAMSEVEAELAVQQVVYTLTAALQDDFVVRFRYQDPNDDSTTVPLDRVLGIEIPEQEVDGTTIPGSVRKAPQLDVLNEMSISDPAEGASYAGSFTARGVSNGFEASVYCRLIDANGTQVWDAPTTAGGWLEPRLFPWRLEVDLGNVEPGEYTFTCTTDDPTGGAEGYGAATDTRSLTVE